MRANATLVACAIGATAVAVSGSAAAQEAEHKVQMAEHKVQMKDLPAAVRKTVDQQAKAGKVRGLSTEKEQGVAPAVRTGLEQLAAGGKIVKIESVPKGGSVAAYEAVVEKNGKKSEIKVGTDGKPIPDAK